LRPPSPIVGNYWCPAKTPPELTGCRDHLNLSRSLTLEVPVKCVFSRGKRLANSPKRRTTTSSSASTFVNAAGGCRRSAPLRSVSVCRRFRSAHAEMPSGKLRQCAITLRSLEDSGNSDCPSTPSCPILRVLALGRNPGSARISRAHASALLRKGFQCRMPSLAVHYLRCRCSGGGRSPTGHYRFS
jgi:hypothetical protein